MTSKRIASKINGRVGYMVEDGRMCGTNGEYKNKKTTTIKRIIKIFGKALLQAVQQNIASYSYGDGCKNVGESFRKSCQRLEIFFFGYTSMK